jgi:radical SAM protein with 4Fe4S-binding SPASM domain
MIKTYEAFLLPPMLLLDITNVCNLRCIHCPHSQKQNRNNDKPIYMTWEQYSNVIGELSQYEGPCLLHIVGDGEPLLHPKIIDMIDLAKRQTKCILNITTNGTMLFPGISNTLLNIGIDIIEVSVDAFTKTVYQKIRIGASYEQVLLNIFYLLDAKRRAKSSTRIIVSIVEQRENRYEIDIFRRFWAPLVDSVVIRKLHSASGRVKLDEIHSRNIVKKQLRLPCPHLWKRLTIDAAGNIKYCPTDWSLESALGSIEKRKIIDIWRGDELRSLRHHHLQGDYEGCEKCRLCTDWTSARWDWGYERLVDMLVLGKPTLAPCLPLLHYR